MPDEKTGNKNENWLEKIDTNWSGHFKLRGSVSQFDDETPYRLVGTERYYDGNAEVRLKNTVYFTDRATLETHYELILAEGDTLRKNNELRRNFPLLFSSYTGDAKHVEDDRRLLDLTKTISEGNASILYHRIDRLALTLLPEWGTVRIGRQAVTWGNGFLFNPMDIFNPFAPSDIERDYKIGDDMLSVQLPLPGRGDFQLLTVPRRNPSNGTIEGDESSLAGKFHLFFETLELDFMAAEHFNDEVIGIGCTGYIGSAAWRTSGTWTFLHGDNRQSCFFFIANIDYSWVWQAKNWYGYIELYYNGLGENDYTKLFFNQPLQDRIRRGELFTTGRLYIGGHVRVELHPLLNVFLTMINNIEDPSGIIQPRAVWDISQNLQLIFGGNLLYGKRNTEFGGYYLPGTDYLYKSPQGVFVWLSYFF